MFGGQTLGVVVWWTETVVVGIWWTDTGGGCLVDRTYKGMEVGARLVWVELPWTETCLSRVWWIKTAAVDVVKVDSWLSHCCGHTLAYSSGKKGP